MDWISLQGETDQHEILHDGRYGSRTFLLPLGAKNTKFDCKYLENGKSQCHVSNWV